MNCRAARFLIAVLAVTAACGQGDKPAPATTAPPVGPAVAMAENAGTVRGKIKGATDSGAWSVAVMEWRAEDPEIVVAVCAKPKPDLTFEIALPAMKYDVPYCVVAFADANGNGQLEKGEDFVGGKSTAPGYEGKDLFLFTAGGTFVGDRAWDLSEVEFLLDVSL